SAPVPRRPFLAKRVVVATAIAALAGALTARAQGGGWPTIELAWAAFAALLSPRTPRFAMHLLGWGALVLGLLSLLGFFAHGFAMLAPGDPSPPPFSLDCAQVAVPFVAAIAMAALGALLAWGSDRAHRRAPILPRATARPEAR